MKGQTQNAKDYLGMGGGARVERIEIEVRLSQNIPCFRGLALELCKYFT